MKIGRISIKNFRSISQLDLNLQPDINAFVGGNESGKSNILKAITKISVEERGKPLSPEDYYSHGNTPPTITLTFVLEGEKDNKVSELFILTPSNEFTITRTGDEFSCSLTAKPVTEVVENSAPEDVIAQPQINVLDQIFPLLPKVIYFPSFEQDEYLKGRDIPLSELQIAPEILTTGSKTIIDVLSLGNITVPDLSITSPRDRLKKLIKGSALIGKTLSDAWNQEPIRVRIDVSDTKLVILVRDGKNLDEKDETSWVWTCPEERSAGFRWFITFYGKFLAADAGDKIILLDDIGLYLHAKAQRDLLQILKKLSGNGNQILYTTHSPYFLDKKETNKIYLVNKLYENGKTGTQATSDWKNKKGFNLPEPLKDIGFTNMRHVFEQKTLVVEGSSDQTFLCDMSSLFKKSGLTSLKDGINIFPANGASNIVPYALLAKGEDYSVGCLFDNDASGLAEYQRASTAKLDNLTTIKLAAGGNNSTIEDLLPLEKYLEALNSVFKNYSDTWKDIKIEDITPTNPPRYKKILPIIRSRLELAEKDFVPEFKDQIIEKMFDSGLCVEDVEDKKGEIEQLFKTINSFF